MNSMVGPNAAMFSVVEVILPTKAPDASVIVVLPWASDPMIIARVK